MWVYMDPSFNNNQINSTPNTQVHTSAWSNGRARLYIKPIMNDDDTDFQLKFHIKFFILIQ